jgi:hypothetical protein
VQIHFIISQGTERFLGDTEQRPPERVQRVPALHTGELHQPFPVVAPASLYGEWSRHCLTAEINQPDFPSGGKDGFRRIGQGKERAITLEAVRFSESADDDGFQG